MDELRDRQKTDSITRFIDGHTVRTNPFGENRAGDRAYRRAERIAAAIHLLTNHLEQTEPVSGAIRTGAVDLLNDMLALRSEMRSPRSAVFGAVQARIRHLISLVRILTVSGSISMQNASTMVEALDELGNFLTSAQRSSLSESVVVSRDDLMDVRMPTIRSARTSVRDIKDNIGNDASSAQMSANGSSVINVSNEGHVSSRAQSIVDILQNGVSMGIKDICAHLPEYSEKMIQRELALLVEGGTVRKTGEKRWSKYTIATN